MKSRSILMSSLLLLTLATVGQSAYGQAASTSEWLQWGRDDTNAKFSPMDSGISRDNVKDLKVDWTFEARSNVYVFPTIKDDWLYVTDYPLFSPKSIFNPRKDGGWLYALDKNTGSLRWEKSIYDYSGSGANIVSRNSPAIFEDLIIFGDAVNIATPANIFSDAKASMYAVNRLTGELVWKTVVENHDAAQITQSPTIHNGVVYIGVSSTEIYLPAALSVLYPCCSHRGSFVALEARTGKILWQTYTVPEADDQTEAFSGASVWGSSPSIDEKRGLVYIATGNNYNAPDAFKSCLRDAKGDAAQEEVCYVEYDKPDNYFDAVLALDMKTGDVRWSQKVMRYDAWNFACNAKTGILPNPISIACPKPSGGDDDFAQAPIFLRDININGVIKDILLVGQKTGVFWAFDAEENGKILWTTKVGPDGIIGGHEFGSASDGKRVYVQITNLEHKSITLQAGPDKGKKTNGGIWAALDVATGEIIWQTANPTSVLPLTGAINHDKWGKGLGLGFFALSQGPLSVANDVVYAGSLDGYMYAMDAETGAILWSKKNAGSVNSAPSIVDGALYWGAGYPVGFPDNKLYKLSP